jgi:hypothetical protein
MLSLRQIQKDINISMSILAVLIQCIEVPQVGPRLLCLALLSTFNAIVFQICVGLQSKQMFALLQPLIAPKDFKYNDGGAFRRRVIQLAVLLAMLGQSEKDFHPWHEIIEKNILVRLQQLHFDAQTFTRIVGDKPRHELLMEQKDLINGVMFTLNREVLPSVAVSYFSNTRNLIALAASISRLNAFTQIPDFDDFRGEDCFGDAVGVTEACCNLLQAVCERFPLSCTVEETRDIFFQYAEEALPMEDGHITETPIVEDDGFADEDDFDFDVTPSRSATVDENDPISIMYMAALRLDATLVRHASSQLDRSFQQQRLRGIMLAMYRKTTLEPRVKSEVLLCILKNYDLACFTREDTEFVAVHLLKWNSLETFLNNIPSALVAIEFMDRVISAPIDQVARDVRIPFLDLSFH